ncbi:MAG: hypothetical protein AAF384_05410 [Pseudomonadota bacterium]
MERLTDIGFVRAGRWLLADEHLHLDLRKYGELSGVLYAFISRGEVKYVRKTSKALETRLGAYESTGHSRLFNLNRERIVTLLQSGTPVEIYVLPDQGKLSYGPFKVNLAAGLEASIIDTLQPPWNSATRKRRRSAEIHDIGSRSLTNGTGAKPGGGAQRSGAKYRFMVGYIYLTEGFFNVPRKYSKLFGNDRERIKILCGDERLPIHGRIDRSANTNYTPRIRGGDELSKWFDQHAGLNEAVDIDILAPNAIWLRTVDQKDSA